MAIRWLIFTRIQHLVHKRIHPPYSKQSALSRSKYPSIIISLIVIIQQCGEDIFPLRYSPSLLISLPATFNLRFSTENNLPNNLSLDSHKTGTNSQNAYSGANPAAGPIEGLASEIVLHVLMLMLNFCFLWK